MKTNTIREYDGYELYTLLMSEAADLKIVDKAGSAKNGEKFKKLWTGDWSGYTSQSEAEMALAGILHFWTKDREVTDRLFSKSGLYRAKWDERHFGNGRTYGEALCGLDR